MSKRPRDQTDPKELAKEECSSKRFHYSAEKPMPPIRFFSQDAPYGELSNFWQLSAPLHIFGFGCATSEHAYQCAKFVYEGATEETLRYARVIAAASTPYKSKLLANRSCGGRYRWQIQLQEVVNQHPKAVIDPAWDSRRLSVMRKILFAKFCADEHCRKVLLSTAGHELEEATSHNDRFWGIGKDGKGENHLGHLLMEARDALLCLL